jgi:hypothetical protein
MIDWGTAKRNDSPSSSGTFIEYTGFRAIRLEQVTSDPRRLSKR